MVSFAVNIVCLFYLCFVLPLVCIAGLIFICSCVVSAAYHRFEHVRCVDNTKQLLERVIIIDDIQHEIHVMLYGNDENYNIVVENI